MKKLVFDIETVGENFDGLDVMTQEALTRWIKSEYTKEVAYQKALTQLKERMGFSPLTGQIVAIGVYDVEKNKGAVYFQAPQGGATDTELADIKYRVLDEKGMLEQFWTLVQKYDEFISFNGRSFDLPFLLVRSAVHGIRPSKDLLRNRFLSSQPANAKSIDLLDQLTFYGTLRKKGSLHLWCHLFGIASPKAEGVTGDDVAKLFAAQKYLEIAQYNAGDLRATKELYLRWEKYLKF